MSARTRGRARPGPVTPAVSSQDMASVTRSTTVVCGVVRESVNRAAVSSPASAQVAAWTRPESWPW